MPGVMLSTVYPALADRWQLNMFDALTTISAEVEWAPNCSHRCQ